MLVLLCLTVSGAWAQCLYLEVDGTAATLKYSANEADYSDKPYFIGTMWQNASGFKTSVKTITVDASCENFAGDKLQGLFANCSELTSITGLGTINTTNVTTMLTMFNYCSKLETVDLSGFNTAKVTTMQSMFSNCGALETLDLSGFNTANVTTMENMFYNCSSLETVDLSSFNTSSVTNMSKMFQGCAGLQTLDLSGFNTSSVTDMRYMFSACTGLKSVNFSGLNTSGVTTMTYMFQGCTGLQTLDLSDLNTSSVTDMRNMFQNCTGLQTLDISSFNTENVTKMGSMFNGCSQLTAIFVGAGWVVATSANSMFTDCTNLPNWDGTSNGTKAYYGGDGKGYLTYKAPEPEPSTYTVTLKEGTDDADNWTITPAEATTTGVAAGTEVKATYGGTKKVKSVKAVKKAKPAATVTTAPTAKTGVKAGEDVAIVNEGTAEGGTMMYMVNATQPASTDGFSATVPTAEGLTAGTYYVWYYVKADDSHTDSEISATGIEVTIEAASLIVNPAVGQVIGDDGKNYNYASLPGGVTAVAKICYVSGEHGLALALTDEGDMDWEAAKTACNNKNTSTPVTNATWKLATEDEWNNMITAAGGYTALRDGFTSVGGSDLTMSRYWSSTEAVVGERARACRFSDGGWSDTKESNNATVRACLAF